MTQTGDSPSHPSDHFRPARLSAFDRPLSSGACCGGGGRVAIGITVETDSVFAAITKPSLRDTLIFIVIFSIIVAAMFALVFFGFR